MGRPAKWPDETVAAVKYGRLVEKRSIKWLSDKYEVPVDTIRDWIFRGRRANVVLEHFFPNDAYL